MVTDLMQSLAALVRLNRISSLIYSMLVPLLIGIYSNFYTDLIKISPILFWGPVIIFTILAVIFAYYCYDIKLAPEVYQELQDHEEFNKAISKDVMYFTTLQEHNLAWNLITRNYIEQRIDGIDNLKLAVEEICGSLVQMRDEYFGFKSRELWKFSVYLYDKNNNILNPIWSMKHHNHPSKLPQRSWTPGEGHVGLAFRDKKTLITGDAHHSEVAAIMSVGSKAKDYDKVYRSFVSQPIFSSDSTVEPFGVIIATSDQLTRFNLANAIVLLHASHVLATLIQVAYDS